MSLPGLVAAEASAPRGGIVFVSCALDDARGGQRIAESLRAVGLEVWFEPKQDGGEVWERGIRAKIKECGIFVPIISARSQARAEGHYRVEWRLADQRTHRMGRSVAFLVPVCIDDTKEEAADVPESFVQVRWTRLHMADTSLGGPAPAESAEPLRRFAEEVKGVLLGKLETGGGSRPSEVSDAAKSAERIAEASRKKALDGKGGRRSPEGKPEVADYQLLRTIGEGSYGEVWLARGMTGLYRAVKVVWRDRFETEEPYEREWRGLKEFAAISLKTEGQMALLHLGRNDAVGFFYYVMELADDANTGRAFDPEEYVPLTLKEWRRRKGRVPAGEVVAAGAELAAGLAALHGRGLVHRDVKPSNAILVNGKAKLADIGLVTAAHEARTFIGTSGYVPPEGPGSPSADVFALGRVLYELATGLDRDEFPKLPEDLERLPDRRELLALNEVLLRAGDPRPERRYRHAGEVQADLERLQAGRGTKRRGASWRWVVLTCLAVLGPGIGTWRWLTDSRSPGAAGTVIAGQNPARATDERSLAVLPFESRSDDRENGYLADGIHEDVVTNFANLRGLKVTSMATVRRYRGTTKTMRAIGEELAVAYVLTGSLRREGNRIRLSAQLVETRTDRQVWARNFEREMAGLFALQSELAAEIVPALHLVLDPDEAVAMRRTPTASATAYDLYLRARAFAENGFYSTKGSADQAEALLRRAVAEDPGFVRAWVELAKLQTDRYQASPEQRSAGLIAAAEEALSTARRLQPGMPEIQLEAGRIRHYCYEDYPRALVIYRDLLRSHPNYHDVRLPLALLYRRLGRWSEALAELREAWRVDRGSRSTVTALVATLEMVRRYEELEAVLASLPAEVRDSPGMVFARAFNEFRRNGTQERFRSWHAGLSEEQRRSESAELTRLHWAAVTGDEATVMELLPRRGLTPERMGLAIIPLRNGNRELAQRLLADLKPTLDRLRSVAPLDAGTWRAWAGYHALRGDRKETLEAIERARELFSESTDAVNGPTFSHHLALALAWVGETDAAIRDIERLVKVPAGGEVTRLKHSVMWLPLRADPRFRAIIEDPANSRPLVGD